MKLPVILASLALSSAAYADMYQITIQQVTVKTADGKKADGNVELSNATVGCNLDKLHPASGKQFTVWFDTSVKADGHLGPRRNKGGADKPIVSCAQDVLINSTFHYAAGAYRVEATVSFQPMKEPEL